MFTIGSPFSLVLVCIHVHFFYDFDPIPTGMCICAFVALGGNSAHCFTHLSESLSSFSRLVVVRLWTVNRNLLEVRRKLEYINNLNSFLIMDLLIISRPSRNMFLILDWRNCIVTNVEWNITSLTTCHKKRTTFTGLQLHSHGVNLCIDPFNHILMRSFVLS